jgi:N-acyl-D-aspartate/D-glutamate deacylase
MTDFDLIVRGGVVVDGTGGPARTADVAITGTEIVSVGQVEGTARRTILADGALVVPGFVDIHTHYDAQVTWESQVAPSSWLGVTTVVMGNCGVGFAPVRPDDRSVLIELMEGVEDMPGAVLREGIRWDWETFPEYLDAIDRCPHDIDVALQVPHGALRVYVMGDQGAHGAPATAEEITRMAAIVKQAVDAGAIGFTTSRTRQHQTSRGDPTPTLTASENELVGIARGLAESGSGVIEVVSDFFDIDQEFGRLQRMASVSGRPLSYSLVSVDGTESWRDLLARTAEAAAAGLSIRGQVAARGIGVLLGLQASLNPFHSNRVYQQIAHLPFPEQRRIMGDPDFRSKVLGSQTPSAGTTRVVRLANRYERIFPLCEVPDYEPPRQASIAAQAARLGCKPEELAYDLLLEDEGRALLYLPILNYSNYNLDDTHEMLLSEYTVPGLGDGGAHVGTICDASFPIFLLAHWARDRTRGARLELPWVVRRQARDTATAVGLCDRGVLAPGYKADLNVIDFERLTLRAPKVAFDLPTGAKRFVQRADGIVATVVSGSLVYEHGEHSGALPGRLVRGAHHAGQ